MRTEQPPTCYRCNCPETIRATLPPRIATHDSHLYFDYWQCPKCGTNHAVAKRLTKKPAFLTDN